MQELDYSNLESHDTIESGYKDNFLDIEQQNEPQKPGVELLAQAPAPRIRTTH